MSSKDSSDNLALAVNNVSKHYEIYATPQDRLKQTILRRKRFFKEFWALRNLSVDIKRGESVGIIGRNGSGKSTLLQIITGTLAPTEGEVRVFGRVAALLELGSGFNPEFTGRENVYLNASILGLSRAEIDAKYEDIVAFADIGQFIDQPVKTYSSGMMVRLAFAVQVQMEPDILIIDEALAVGDELFQRKCYSALADFHQSGGTLVFVSHAGGIVKELCDRAVLLDAGEMLMCADSRTTVDEYHRYIFANEQDRPALREQIKSKHSSLSGSRAAPDKSGPAPAQPAIKEADVADEYYAPEMISQCCVSYPSQVAVIRNQRITNADGKQLNHLVAMRRYRFSYEVEFMSGAKDVIFSMMVKSTTGLELGGNTSAKLGRGIPFVTAGELYRVVFEFSSFLTPGVFYLNCGVNGSSENHEGMLARLVDCVVFRMLPRDDSLRSGYVDFECVPVVEKVNP